MGKFILGFNDEGLNATFQSTNAFKPELGLQQLNIQYTSSVLHTDDTSELTININLSTHHTIGVLAVINHNLTPAATIQWQAFSDLGHTTSLYDSGDVVVGDFDESLHLKNTVLAMANINAAYLVVVIKDATNPDGFIQIGNLMCCERFNTECNMNYGYSALPVDISSVFVSDGGINSYSRKPIKREFNMGFSLRTLDEGNRAFKLMLRQGVTKRMVYQFDEDDTLEGLYTISGTLKTLSALQYPFFNVNNFNFALSEEI